MEIREILRWADNLFAKLGKNFKFVEGQSKAGKSFPELGCAIGNVK
jgi:hypothetical protein